MDQVFIMLQSNRLDNTSTSISSNSSSRTRNKTQSRNICSLSSSSSQSSSSSFSSSCTIPNKSISLHWIALIWLAAVLPSSLKYHAHGLDELHIGGIFPIGGKGGWVSRHYSLCKRNNNQKKAYKSSANIFNTDYF